MRHHVGIQHVAGGVGRRDAGEGALQFLDRALVRRGPVLAAREHGGQLPLLITLDRMTHRVDVHAVEHRLLEVHDALQLLLPMFGQLLLGARLAKRIQR